MHLETSSYVVIILALIGANIPFLSHRMFIFSPIAFHTEPQRWRGYYAIRAFLFYAVLIAALFIVSTPLLSAAIKLSAAVVALLLFTVAGLVYKPYVRTKNILIHVVEMVCFMCWVAGIGFFIESYYSNSFDQHWPFYAIGASIFTIMGLPGFVWRYLMRHRNRIATEKDGGLAI